MSRSSLRQIFKAELISYEAISTGRGLHQQAEEQGADLLVVGSCGRGMFGRAMLGDDTHAALNGAPCAVAVARVGYAEYPTPLATVGVGYDDSPESKTALETARLLAAPTRASVHVLQVIALPSYTRAGFITPAFGEIVQSLVADASERLSKLPDVQARVVYGLASEELAAFGDELDLLVVGSRGYGPVRRLILGSTADYLQRHAHCSLLVLPRGAAGSGKQQAMAEPEGRDRSPR